MTPIVTLTVNPAIDAFHTADEVVPIRKIRTRGERYEPGGGGLNVSRMVKELGGETVAFYMAGGLPGKRWRAWWSGWTSRRSASRSRGRRGSATSCSRPRPGRSTGSRPRVRRSRRRNGATVWRCSPW
jgi:hypothetical protein